MWSVQKHNTLYYTERTERKRNIVHVLFEEQSNLQIHPQKIWPFGNVKGPLVTKYLDRWQNTDGGLTQEPQ